MTLSSSRGRTCAATAQIRPSEGNQLMSLTVHAAPAGNSNPAAVTLPQQTAADGGPAVHLVNAAGAGNVTVTLPAASFNQHVTLSRIDSGAATVTVDPAAGTINGSASVTVAAGAVLRLVCDGVNWWSV
jgi:hypothetical protein